VHPPKPN